MPTKIELMRQKLREKESSGSSGGDGAAYPFWKIASNGTCTVRFLPDADDSNPFFWLERQEFKWDFVDNQNPHQSISIKMPCREMYDGAKTCQITNELRSWFKGNGDEELARKYWPKKSYLYQGIIRRSELQEQQTPENPIRILPINKSIHQIIKDTVLSDNPDDMFEISPDDYEAGTDFIIKKTTSGEYASYNTSRWANKTSPLDEDELAAVEKHGLFNLKERLAARPSDEAFEVQAAMFEASVNGEAWNPEWEKFFKPWRDKNSQGDGETEGSALANQTTSVETGQDALSKLRARKGAASEAPEDDSESDAPTAKTSKDDVIAKLRAKKLKNAS